MYIEKAMVYLFLILSTGVFNIFFLKCSILAENILCWALAQPRQPLTPPLLMIKTSKSKLYAFELIHIYF